MRKTEDFWLLEEDHVNKCNDCPHPNGCVGECKLEKHVHEDVAKVRGEQEQ